MLYFLYISFGYYEESFLEQDTPTVTLIPFGNQST